MIKRLSVFIIMLLVIFTFLLFKSKALLFYKVTEIRKRSMHTELKVTFDWDVFLDYLKDTPDRVMGSIFSRGIKASKNVKLSDKEQENIKNLIKDSGALTGDLNAGDMEISQQVKQLLENYKGLDGLMEKLEAEK